MSKRPKDPNRNLGQEIEALKKKAEELGIEALELDPDTPEDVQHTFWSDLLAYEATEARPVFDVLAASGIELPAPFKLNEDQAHDVLWEVIHGLAFIGTFLHHTDHLSDHELYTQLWKECLRRPAVLLPENPSFGYHIDLVGGTTHEEEMLRLRFYADPDERGAWALEHSSSELPPAQEAPYDRDSRLPRQPLHAAAADSDVQ